MSFIVTKKMMLSDYIIYSTIILISVICVFPFLYVLSVSLTHPNAYVPLSFYIIPRRFSIIGYQFILSTNTFMRSLYNTLYITSIGTLVNLFVTFTFAYGLTRRSLPGRKIFLAMVIITLLFSAGLVPNYLMIRNLGLLNSHWALILIAATNSWSLIVVKSFMDSIPSELEESAQLDGCTDLAVFTKIIIPLSLPAIAAFTLFFAVFHWNTYFNAMIYLSDARKWTLQVLVKTLIIDSDTTGVGTAASIGAGAGDMASLPQETIRMAAVILSMLPILIVYPFLQKYFVKGVMIGAIKG